MTTDPKTNVEGARTHVNDAIQNLTAIYGDAVPTDVTLATSSAATAQALIAIACQLDRIANAIEARPQVSLDGRDFAAVIAKARASRTGR